MRLTNTFLKVVKQSVNDCSNPIQLRGYLNQYQNYVMSTEIKKVFTDRIEFFKERFSSDALYLRQIEDLEDDLDINVQIASVCQSSLIRFDDNMKKIVRSRYEGHSQEERDLLILVFRQCSGDTDDIMRHLRLSYDQLISKIKLYNLGEMLAKIAKKA